MSTFLDCYRLALIGQQYAMYWLASDHQPTLLCREADAAAEHLLVFYFNDLGNYGDGRPLCPLTSHHGMRGFADANGERLIGP